MSTTQPEPSTPSLRPVVVYALLSLDGVAEDPDRFFDVWDAGMDERLGRVIADQDTVVLGRRSYDEWAAYWPTSPDEPFASFINAVPKYVATSTPLTGSWNAAQAIEGDLVDFVKQLTTQPGGQIGVHASISVAQTLLSAGVVDELRLLIAPLVIGHGRRLLDGVPGLTLDLLGPPSGHLGTVFADYRVVRDGS